MKVSLLLLIIIFSATQLVTGQPDESGLRYEINRVDPPLAISQNKLLEAQTIDDLHRNYKSSWVREYLQTKITVSINGEMQSIIGANNLLTEEQKKLLNKADNGTEISINVSYIPENSLKNNEPKVIDFSFEVIPSLAAHYPNGYDNMMQYLKSTAIEKIDIADFESSALAAITFTVSKEGKVTDAAIFESSKDTEIDNILLAAINSMPNWNPATYSDGSTTDQNFAFTVGNLESCVMNLIPVSRD